MKMKRADHGKRLHKRGLCLKGWRGMGRMKGREEQKDGIWKN